MNTENYFISLFGKDSDVIGDDGAVIGEWVYSKDAFFENVHFSRKWMDLRQAAYRSMMVNISDAIAMNARPVYALLAVAMPKNVTKQEMNLLFEGFRSAADAYDVKLIGGDTIANTKLDISVTLVSRTRRPLLRKGLKAKDCIAYTGRLGQSLKELRYLMAGGAIHSASRFNKFTLRDTFVTKAVHALHCGMDISDGLFSDLEKLSSVNGLGYALKKRYRKQVACSGEEYEMLVGFSPRMRKKVVRLAEKTRTPITIIGTARRGRFKNRCKAHHF